MNSLAQIVQGGRALAYSLGNLDQQFRVTFPGYRTTPTAYYVNYKNWSQTSLDTTLGTLRAAGLQGQQLQSEQASSIPFRECPRPPTGECRHKRNGPIAEQQVQQLMKLRELMLADMSSKQAYQAAIIQEKASNEAAAEWFFSGGPVNNTGSPTGLGGNCSEVAFVWIGKQRDAHGDHLGLAGCAREPKSAIVQKVEAAGSGDLSSVSNTGMKEWLVAHKDLAYQVDEMCKPVRSMRRRAGVIPPRDGFAIRRENWRFLDRVR